MMSIEEPADESKVLLHEKSLPFELDAEQQKMSLLNVTTNSDETLTERRGDFQNVPQAACASMPDLSRVPSNRTLNRSGRVTPVRPLSLREYDEELSALKKENFNLKLRIHFLDSQLPKVKSLAGEDVIKLNMELQVTMDKQTGELERKTELLEQALQNIKQMETHYEIEIQELRNHSNLVEKQLEAQLASQTETLTKLQYDSEQLHRILKEKEVENQETRLALTEAEAALKSRENESDSEGFSSISLLDEKEREILDLKGLVAEREYQLTRKDQEIQEIKEKIDQDPLPNNQSLLEQSERTPRIVEQTGVEMGSLFVAPETEEMISCLEKQLRQKDAELDELRQSLRRTETQLGAAGSHEECETRLKEVESKLKTSEENGLKRDKTIQGLVKLVDKERRTNGQSTFGATTLMSRANAEMDEPGPAPMSTEQGVQTTTPDFLQDEPVNRQLDLTAPTSVASPPTQTEPTSVDLPPTQTEPTSVTSPPTQTEPTSVASPRTQVAEGLARATPEELREILDRIQNFLKKQNGVVQTAGLKFGVERSAKKLESPAAELVPVDYVEITTTTPPGRIEDIHRFVTVEDRLKVTEFVRVISATENRSQIEDELLPGDKMWGVDALTTSGRPSMPANWMLGETLAEMTSATDLLNRTANTSMDLGNLRKRLYDLRKICDRLYNKLRGSFKFLKKLLEQLGGAELARQFQDEFGALQTELEESLNATNAIFEEVKTAEISVSEFVSELQVVSRRLSETPHRDTSVSRLSRVAFTPLDLSVAQPKTLDSASNTDLKAAEIETLIQTLAVNEELNNKNEELEKNLDVLNREVASAQEYLRRMKEDYREAVDLLEGMKKKDSEKKKGRSIGISTEWTTVDLENVELTLRKYEQYFESVNKKLTVLGRTVGANQATNASPLKTVAAQIEDICAKLGFRNEEVEQMRQDLERRVNTTEASNILLRDAVNKAQTACGELRRELEALREENEKLLRSKQGREVGVETDMGPGDLEKLEKFAKKYQDVIRIKEELETRVKETERINIQLKDEVEKAQTACAGAKKEMERIQEEYEERARRKEGKEVAVKTDLVGEDLEKMERRLKKYHDLRKDLERMKEDLEAAEGTNVQLTDDVKKAQAACGITKKELRRVQEEYEKLARRKQGREVEVETEMGGEQLGKMEERVRRYSQYIQIVKERVGKFKEDIGAEEERRSAEVETGSPTRSRKIDKIFDDLTKWILTEREDQKNRIEELEKHCDELENGQVAKSENLEDIIRQLNENNAELERRLRDADDAIRNAKENVPPSDPAHNCEQIMKEIEDLRQTNVTLQTQLMQTMQILSNTQERLNAKSTANEEAKDGIVRELSKIRAVLKQSKQDVTNQQRGKRGKNPIGK